MKIREIVIDAKRPGELARFWEAALDGYSVLLDPEGNAFCVQDPR